MTVPPAQSSKLQLDQFRKRESDLTGRERLVSNVLFNWAAHFVFIVAGFIMPRMIDRRLGQELLGVWDFAWSLVNYFTLVQAGVGSSVNRYVAKYRAIGDVSSLNRIVSTAFCIQTIAGMVVLGLTIGLALILPGLFSGQLGENVLDAQWVVFLLGASMAIEMSLGVFTGVLTGCHRWGLHGATKSGWHVVMVAGMITALVFGSGLRSLSVIILAGFTLTGITHIIAANHVCSGLRLRLSLVDRKTTRELILFGSKTLIPSVSNLLLNQTLNILIVAYLGPTALALYARPRSLVHHVNTLVNKMSHVLTPTTSSMQSIENLDGIRELSIKATRYSLYFVLPIVLILMVFGSEILQVWMGPRYANSLLPAILAVGYLGTIMQMPAMKILGGMNAHGRAGIAQFIASVCSLGMAVFALGSLGLGLKSVAIAATLPLAVVNIGYLPLLICSRLRLDLGKFFSSVTLRPALHVLPFAVCLVLCRFAISTNPLTGLVLGGSMGGGILAVIYWLYVIPDRLKSAVASYVVTRHFSR